MKHLLIPLITAAIAALTLVGGSTAFVSPLPTPPPTPTPRVDDWGHFYDCWPRCVWLEGEAFEDCGEGCAEIAGIDPWMMATGTPIVVPERTPVLCYPLYARYPVRCYELTRRSETYWEANWWHIWWETPTPEPTRTPAAEAKAGEIWRAYLPVVRGK